jgi:CubicO group peptidase (beta-lactamase class C family)
MFAGYVLLAVSDLAAAPASILTAAPASTSVRASGPPPGLAARLDRIVSDDGAPGVTLLVFRRDRLLYRINAGRISDDTVLPVASASKWMVAALVMRLVDAGRLSLDAPIGDSLPEFTGAAARITLRQILSFTSGQGSIEDSQDLWQDPHISLRESARLLAAIPLMDPPGTAFRYGGPAMQIAGALVEQATGKSWSSAFDEWIGGPLGLTHTFWIHPLWPSLPPEDVHNPILQGGVVTTAADYGRFLAMVANDGVFQGHRILSHAAVDAMERVQTGDAKMAFVPGGRTDLRYALGNWCEREDSAGLCTIVSSPGILGTYPWIDRRNGIYGVFFMHRRLPLVEKDIQAARRLIEAGITESDGTSSHQ